MELSWVWFVLAVAFAGWTAFVYLLAVEVGRSRARKRERCARCGRPLSHPSRLYTDCLNPVRSLTPDTYIK